MSTQRPIININREDDRNSAEIIRAIREYRIMDEDDVRTLVAAREFSSTETRDHVMNALLSFLKTGFFSQPEPKGVRFEAMPTDAPSLFDVRKTE